LEFESQIHQQLDQQKVHSQSMETKGSVRTTTMQTIGTDHKSKIVLGNSGSRLQIVE
jgi:predicted DNA-binding protein with PD1-like motif